MEQRQKMSYSIADGCTLGLSAWAYAYWSAKKPALAQICSIGLSAAAFLSYTIKDPFFNRRLSKSPLRASLIGVGVIEAISALRLIYIDRSTGFFKNYLYFFSGIGLKIPVGMSYFSLNIPPHIIPPHIEARLFLLKEENIISFLDSNDGEAKEAFSYCVKSGEILPDSQIEKIILVTHQDQRMAISWIYEELAKADRWDLVQELFQKIIRSAPQPGILKELEEKISDLSKKSTSKDANVEQLLKEFEELKMQLNQLNPCLQAIYLWNRLTDCERSTYASRLTDEIVQKAEESYKKCEEANKWLSSKRLEDLNSVGKILKKKRSHISAFSALEEVFNSTEKLLILAKALRVSANQEAITKKLAEGGINTANDLSDLLNDTEDLQKVANEVASEVLGDGSQAFTKIFSFFRSDTGIKAVKEAFGVSGDAPYDACLKQLCNLGLRNEEDVTNILGHSLKTIEDSQEHYLSGLQKLVAQKATRPQQQSSSSVDLTHRDIDTPLKAYLIFPQICSVGIWALTGWKLLQTKRHVAYSLAGFGVIATIRARHACVVAVAQSAVNQSRILTERIGQIRVREGAMELGWRTLREPEHFHESVVVTLIAATVLCRLSLLGSMVMGGLVGVEVGRFFGGKLAWLAQSDERARRVRDRYLPYGEGILGQRLDEVEEDALDLLYTQYGPLY